MSVLSRNGDSSPMGKCTAQLPGFRVPEDTAEEVARQASRAGMAVSEWLRTLVMVRVHGIDMVATLHAERLKVVAGMDKERDVA